LLSANSLGSRFEYFSNIRKNIANFGIVDAQEDFDSISLQISSIACRALMHFNTHDVPRRFQSIRKSRLISSYQMERENRRTFSSFYYGHLQPFSKGKDYIDIVHR